MNRDDFSSGPIRPEPEPEPDDKIQHSLRRLTAAFVALDALTDAEMQSSAFSVTHRDEAVNRIKKALGEKLLERHLGGK